MRGAGQAGGGGEPHAEKQAGPRSRTTRHTWRSTQLALTILRGLRYPSRKARSSARPARVVRLFVWPRHTNGTVAVAPLDPCARGKRASGGIREGRAHGHAAVCDGDACVWRAVSSAQRGNVCAERGRCRCTTAGARRTVHGHGCSCTIRGERLSHRCYWHCLVHADAAERQRHAHECC